MTTGADLDAQVVDLADLYRWTYQHIKTVTVRHKRRNGPDVFSHQTPIVGHKGSPDWLLVKWPRVVFIETKGDGDSLSADQKVWREQLERCPGVEYYVIRPKDAPKLAAILSG